MTHRRVRLLRCGCKHCSVHVERGWKKPGNPNMAPKLERFVSPGKGNGLRAAVRVQRGELVYCAAPLACVVSNKVSADVCHHCFSRWDVLGHADVHAAFLKSQLVPAPALAWYMCAECVMFLARVSSRGRWRSGHTVSRTVSSARDVGSSSEGVRGASFLICEGDAV